MKKEESTDIKHYGSTSLLHSFTKLHAAQDGWRKYMYITLRSRLAPSLQDWKVIGDVGSVVEAAVRAYRDLYAYQIDG